MNKATRCCWIRMWFSMSLTVSQENPLKLARVQTEAFRVILVTDKEASVETRS